MPRFKLYFLYSICVFKLYSTQGSESPRLDESRKCILFEGSSGFELPEVNINGELRGDFLGYTALHEAAFTDNTQRIQILIKLGANPDLPTIFNQTPLHFAGNSGSKNAFKLLIKLGADSQLKDNWGNAPKLKKI